MQAKTEAGRLMTYAAAIALDKAHTGDVIAQAEVDILTPIVKSWCTDMACDVTSTGIQVHGGMGFVEETGAAQYYRDARILPIYEGTNGIQSADFLFRKVVRDGGQAFLSYIAEIKKAVQNEDLKSYIEMLEAHTQKILQYAKDQKLKQIASIATPYLEAAALCVGGALMDKAQSALASESDKDFAQERGDIIATYHQYVMPATLSALRTIEITLEC